MSNSSYFNTCECDIEKAKIEAIAKIVSAMIESNPSYAEKIEDVILRVSKAFRESNK